MLFQQGSPEARRGQLLDDRRELFRRPGLAEQDAGPEGEGTSQARRRNVEPGQSRAGADHGDRLGDHHQSGRPVAQRPRVPL